MTTATTALALRPGAHARAIAPQKKENPSWGPIILITGKSPVYTPRQYEQLAREGYQKLECIYACVDKIAEAFAGVRWVGYTKKMKAGKSVREELSEDHEIMRLLAHPNPRQAQARFFDEGIRYLLLAGNNYVYKAGPKMGAPRELYNQRPDRMRVVPGTTLQPVAGYEYRTGGAPLVYRAEEILHLKEFHPTNDWYGLSKLEVAAPEIDVLNLSAEWNARLLTNDARPSMLIKTAGNITDEQYDRIKEMMQSDWLGYLNAGKPIGPLEGGLEAQIISLSPKDMDFYKLDKQTRLKIATVFNVAPELIGDGENKTYSNYQEARKALYQDNILPKLNWWRDELNNWLVPLFGEMLVVDYDRESIEAIRDDRSKLIVDLNSMVDRGSLNRNEQRQALGWERIEGLDGYTVAGSVVPLDAITGLPEGEELQ
jgi:HK97 family phage portal protein